MFVAWFLTLAPASKASGLQTLAGDVCGNMIWACPRPFSSLTRSSPDRWSDLICVVSGRETVVVDFRFRSAHRFWLTPEGYHRMLLCVRSADELNGRRFVTIVTKKNVRYRADSTGTSSCPPHTSAKMKQLRNKSRLQEIKARLAPLP